MIYIPIYTFRENFMVFKNYLRSSGDDRNLRPKVAKNWCKMAVEPVTAALWSCGSIAAAKEYAIVNLLKTKLF